MRRARLALLILAALLVPSLPSLAEDAGPGLAADGERLVFSALGEQLRFPAPEWFTGTPDAALGAVEQSVTADERQALIVLYPQGESATDWSNLYAARITRDASRPLEDVRRAMMVTYAQTCDPAHGAFFQLEADAGEALAPLGFVCGRFSARLAGFEDQGEVMVMAFKRSDEAVAIVYQEWRGAAFDPEDVTQWPVPAATVEARSRAIGAEAELLAR